MKVDTTAKGILASLVYFIGAAYTWIESTGLNPKIFTILAIFIFLDMVLGWIKAATVKDLPDPSSKKAKKGILAKAVMFVIPAVLGLIWWALGTKEVAMKVVNVLLTGLMIAEGYSNIGNAYTIYTGEVLSEFDAITYIFKRAAQIIRKMLAKLLDFDPSLSETKDPQDDDTNI